MLLAFRVAPLGMRTSLGSGTGAARVRRGVVVRRRRGRRVRRKVVRIVVFWGGGGRVRGCGVFV